MQAARSIILIIEDEPSTLAALERLFRRDFDVKAASSAEKALEILERYPQTAIILTDYMLPQRTGLELLQETKVKYPSAIRIVLTGHLAVEELGDAMDKDIIHRVFLKPWDNDLLLIQMQEASKQSQLVMENKTLGQLAMTDPITQLHNHRAFMENGEKEIERAKRHRRVMSLLMIDIDQFKLVNDTMGHLEGDNLLRNVGNILKDNLRNIDTVYRYAGDEFSILLPDTEKTPAFDVAERLRQRSAFLLSGVTLSLGLACFPEDADDLKNLINRADQALYQAKRNGRNQTIKA